MTITFRRVTRALAVSVFVAVFSSGHGAPVAQQAPADALERGFADPPAGSRTSTPRSSATPSSRSASRS
jgi:hypothetical protein